MIKTKNKQSLDFLNRLLPIGQNLIQYIDVRFDSFIDMVKNDPVVWVLVKMIVSTNIFGIEIIDDPKQSGVFNQDNKPDIRLNYRRGEKLKLSCPPFGFDGYIVVNLSRKYQNMNGVPVSHESILFHEIVENYERVEMNLSYADAHEFARKLEIELLSYRNNNPVYSGLAGEMVEEIK